MIEKPEHLESKKVYWDSSKLWVYRLGMPDISSFRVKRFNIFHHLFHWWKSDSLEITPAIHLLWNSKIGKFAAYYQQSKSKTCKTYFDHHPKIHSHIDMLIPAKESDGAKLVGRYAYTAAPRGRRPQLQCHWFQGTGNYTFTFRRAIWSKFITCFFTFQGFRNLLEILNQSKAK